MNSRARDLRDFVWRLSAYAPDPHECPTTPDAPHTGLLTPAYAGPAPIAGGADETVPRPIGMPQLVRPSMMATVAPPAFYLHRLLAQNDPVIILGYDLALELASAFLSNGGRGPFKVPQEALDAPATSPPVSQIGLTVTGRASCIVEPTAVRGVVTVADVLRTAHRCLREPVPIAELRHMSLDARTQAVKQATIRQAKSKMAQEHGYDSVLRIDLLLGRSAFQRVVVCQEMERVWLEVQLA